MARSIATFKQFFLESTETEVEQYRNLFDELSQSSAEVMFRGLLNSQDIEYAEQYQIDKKRKFLIDFAFPDIQTAIEINGPFHYEKERKNWSKASKKIIDSEGENNNFSELVEKYQLRHTFIKELNWRVIEIPTSIVNKNNELILRIINQIKTKISKVPKENKFNYDQYKYEPKRNIRLKSTEENINLLTKLVKTKTYREIAKDIINKISLNTGIKNLSARISKFCREHGIKEKRNDLFNKILEKINEIMPTIDDRNSLSFTEMARRLKTYNINVSNNSLIKWIKDKQIHNWIPYDPSTRIFKINEIMPTIDDRNSLSFAEMVRRLKTYNINVSKNTLIKWIKDEQIHNWIPCDTFIRISTINETIPKIDDRNSLSFAEMVRRLKTYNINVSHSALTKWFADKQIHNWIPYDPSIVVSKINEIMPTINDRNSLSFAGMVKRLKTYNINVSHTTLNKWFTDKQIHSWTPYDLSMRISKINEIISSIDDRNSLSIKRMTERLKDYNINVSHTTLNKWFTDKQIHNWIPKRN